MSADPVTITTTGPAPDALVTEAEYQAREAARPPSGGGSSFGVTVTTEAALREALPIGGRIHVNVKGVLPLAVPEVVKFTAPGTVLCGLGKNTTTLAIKEENPNNVSFWTAAKNLTIEHITLDSEFHTWHTVYGDCDSNPSGLLLDNIRIQNCTDGWKYVGAIWAPPCLGLTFRNSEIINFKGRGAFIDCDVADLVIENFYLKGTGNDLQTNTGIWAGQGLLGGRIAHGKIEHCALNGLELFYPQVYPTKSQLSRDNPFGAGMIISGLEIADITNIACSLAGCKRCVVSDIHIRDSGAGMEYIDEINHLDGVPIFSDYQADNVTVARCSNVAVTIHMVKRGRFTNHVITDCASFGCQIYNGADEITFQNSTLARCANGMLFLNGAHRTVITGNEFLKTPGDPAIAGFHAFGGGPHIFSGNILRGGLITTADQASILTAPGVAASVVNGVFTDSHNYRFPA